MARNLWLRLYTSILDCQKVQHLTAELFRALVNLWCVAKENDGVLPAAEEIAWRLRVKPEKVKKWLADLRNPSNRLIEEVDGCYVPHDWHEHQYDSDSSTERVARYRAKKRSVSSTAVGSVAPSAPDAVSVTPRARGRAEQSRAEQSREEEKQAGEPASQPAFELLKGTIKGILGRLPTPSEATDLLERAAKHHENPEVLACFLSRRAEEREKRGDPIRSLKLLRLMVDEDMLLWMRENANAVRQIEQAKYSERKP